MAKFKLKDFAKDISVAIKDAQSSPLKQFVGLEHYDSGEPVITRFTDTSLISSSVKEFKENIMAKTIHGKPISYWSHISKDETVVKYYYDKIVNGN